MTWPTIMLCRARFNLPAVMPGGLFTDDTFEVPEITPGSYLITNLVFPPKPAAPFGYTLNATLNIQLPSCAYLFHVSLQRLPLGAGNFGFTIQDFYHFGDPFELRSGVQAIIISPGGTANATIKNLS